MPRQRYRVTVLSDRHSFIRLSDRIAIITKALQRPGKNRRRARVVSAYFGFSTQDEAIAFVAGLRRYFPKAFCQVRAAQRLEGAYEVKVRGFEGLERFTWTLAENPAIVSPTESPAPVNATSTASNVVSFDRTSAPLVGRSRGRTARIGSRVLSID